MYTHEYIVRAPSHDDFGGTRPGCASRVAATGSASEGRDKSAQAHILHRARAKGKGSDVQEQQDAKEDVNRMRLLSFSRLLHLVVEIQG